MAKKSLLSRKEQVMLTALQLIKSNGLQSASMADISAGSGVAVGTIYHHFASREALIDALRHQLAEQLAGAVTANLQGKGTHKDKVMMMWNNAHEFFTKNPLAASFLDQYASSALGSTSAGMFKLKALSSVQDFIKDGIKQNKIRKVEAEWLFEWMISSVLTTLRVANNKQMTPVSKKSIEVGAEMCWASFKA
jgi:AcrR family transcriptional regulator